jgi:hypothetical protein
LDLVKGKMTAQEIQTLRAQVWPIQTQERRAVQWEMVAENWTPARIREVFGDDPHGLVMQLLARVEAHSPYETPRTGCQICCDTRGGVPGNGNIVNGIRVCDYCHADMLAYRPLVVVQPSETPQEREDGQVERTTEQ